MLNIKKNMFLGLMKHSISGLSPAPFFLEKILKNEIKQTSYPAGIDPSNKSSGLRFIDPLLLKFAKANKSLANLLRHM